jgi:hypothetical protein
MRWLPAVFVFPLLHAAAVKQDRTVLRTGCYPDSDAIATLEKGTALKIQSSRSGESEQCYKVLAEVNGKKVEGFLTASLIEDVEGFDQARRSATWLDVKQIVSAIQESSQRSSGPAASSLSIASTGAAAKQAALLLDNNQPAKALALLETELKKNKDAGVYAMAGVAAWKSDDTAKAVEYVRASLEMRPSPDLQRFYEELERQNKGDKSGERLLGMRVQLRYEGVTIAPETARQMLNVLDEEFGRISSELGCAAEERILAIAQSPAAYRQTTNAAEWSGGQFDGKIRIPVQEKNVDRRVLAHEIAHACLAMIGSWPSWLHEGIAQKISGDTLPASMQKRLSELAGQGKLPKLENLAQDWSRMNTENANLAYSLALYAVEVFARDFSSIGFRNLLRSPERLPAVTADLDKRIGF